MLLTDEEMLKAVKTSVWGFGCERIDADRMALAQARKLVEWLDGDCTEHGKSPLTRFKCFWCWQALKEEVGV